MGILIKKQRGNYGITPIAKLSIVGLIVALSAAYIDTIWAIYLDSFLNSPALVGFLSAALTAISFFSYFFIIPIIEKNNKKKIYSWALFLFMIAYLLLALNKNFYLLLILAIAMTILHAFRITSFGLLIKDNSIDKKLSSNEGLIYTFSNIAWVVGPLIAGFIAAELGINWVFIFSASFVCFGLIFFKFSKIKNNAVKKKIDRDIRKNFIDFFKDKKRLLAYVLGGGVNAWWSFIYLFIPLMIIREGLGDMWVGYFLFGIAVPLILFEYKFSTWAGKKGFKKVFKIGYLIPSLIALICFFVPNIYLILLLLILASIGLAMIEPTTEAYFLDVLEDREKDRFYGPYNTAIDAGNFISKILASAILFFLPFKFIFLLMFVLMFIFFLLSFKIKNIIEARRK